jgi:DNA-binding NtrC family response regulator
VPRILLVEDDRDTRFLWQHALIDAGYDVDTAETVEAGCDRISRRGYDLVVTDGRLEDGIGVTVADAARERGIPALLVTGYAFILDELRADPDKYELLLKPIRPGELVDAVMRTLAAI